MRRRIFHSVLICLPNIIHNNNKKNHNCIVFMSIRWCYGVCNSRQNACSQFRLRESNWSRKKTSRSQTEIYHIYIIRIIRVPSIGGWDALIEDTSQMRYRYFSQSVLNNYLLALIRINHIDASLIQQKKNITYAIIHLFARAAHINECVC